MEESARRPRVLVGLMFFPRGGSAQVTRSLARALPPHGWDVKIVSGSLCGDDDEDGLSDAKRFFEGLDVMPVEYGSALKAQDPMRADPPMHPSYEDRPGAADIVFARLDDDGYEHQVQVWSRILREAGAAQSDVLHLHHLTPLHEAAARVAPEVPVIAHIHGTELLMLEEIAEGPPAGWDHADAWAERMRRWAHRASNLMLLSDGQAERLEPLLGVDPSRCTAIPNGFDPAIFERLDVDRAAHWRRHLVERPRGWRPGGRAGSVSYTEEQIASLADPEGTVLLYVGRYTAVKRINLLIRAFAQARQRFDGPAGLVILGGFPDEWEGEHPLETIEATSAQDVFLAGWHDHPALPGFFGASDAVVLPSVREQFGQVLVEGMACGLPAIAIDSHGPGEIVDDGDTGWLVGPDDEEGMAAALVEAVNDPLERRRRGDAAQTAVCERYSWPALAKTVAELYDSVRSAPTGA